MSWNIYTSIVRKSEINQAIKNLTLPEDNPQANKDQLESAKLAALEQVKVIPGPFVSVHITGHANGKGEEQVPGYSSDFITLATYQYYELPIK